MRWNLMIFTGKRPHNSGFGEGIGRAPEAFCRLRQNGVAAEPWKARPTLAADPSAEKNSVYFYSCGGFNTPTLCVEIKGIESDCNTL